MTNIPTELLRTLVAVVDLRSFTKAAQSLGVTQPAVSAQIKRLHGLLGTEILDKSAPGVALTPAGELVVNYARRLLSINDQILDFAAPRRASQTLRIGATGDFTAAQISYGLARFRARYPQSRFMVRSTSFDELLRGLREGETDIAVWVSPTGPTFEARHCWTEQPVWLRGATLQLDPAGAVPLVSYGPQCPLTSSMIATLNSVGRDSELVYVGSSIAGLGAAVASGIGVTALPPQQRRHARRFDLERCALAQAAGGLLRHLRADERRSRRPQPSRRRAGAGLEAESPLVGER
jgi:DNA-binding transcriptional LysR family regulator